MGAPWIKNYEGEWENSEGFLIVVRLIDEDSASVDIALNGKIILRPWCENLPAFDLSAVYREGDGLGLEVDLGRDGFSLFLDCESAGGICDDETLAAGISRLESDQEAERWTSLIGIEPYHRIKIRAEQDDAGKPNPAAS